MSTTFNTSPAINSQLLSPLFSAFSIAASTASSTISTPYTFSDSDAKSCAIVPVPEYRSNTDLPAVSPRYLPATLYKTSAPLEFVWKKEKGVILKSSPFNLSII